MHFYAGTSGYAYKKWKGSFYPEGLPAKGMLGYYGRHFRAVEINSTFYRMPTVTVLEAWADAVPADFRFVLKAPRQITHIQRLKDADQSLATLLATADVLKERLGALLFQLPPNLKKGVPRLKEFLSLLPPQCRASFEFRHASWFDDEIFIHILPFFPDDPAPIRFFGKSPYLRRLTKYRIHVLILGSKPDFGRERIGYD